MFLRRLGGGKDDAIERERKQLEREIEAGKNHLMSIRQSSQSFHLEETARSEGPHDAVITRVSPQFWGDIADLEVDSGSHEPTAERHDSTTQPPSETREATTSSLAPSKPTPPRSFGFLPRSLSFDRRRSSSRKHESATGPATPTSSESTPSATVPPPERKLTKASSHERVRDVQRPNPEPHKVETGANKEVPSTSIRPSTSRKASSSLLTSKASPLLLEREEKALVDEEIADAQLRTAQALAEFQPSSQTRQALAAAAVDAAAAAAELRATRRAAETETVMAVIAHDVERAEARRLLNEALQESDERKRSAQKEEAWALEAAAAAAMTKLQASKQLALEEKTRTLDQTFTELLSAVKALLYGQEAGEEESAPARSGDGDERRDVRPSNELGQADEEKDSEDVDGEISDDSCLDPDRDDDHPLTPDRTFGETRQSSGGLNPDERGSSGILDDSSALSGPASPPDSAKARVVARVQRARRSISVPQLQEESAKARLEVATLRMQAEKREQLHLQHLARAQAMQNELEREVRSLQKLTSETSSLRRLLEAERAAHSETKRSAAEEKNALVQRCKRAEAMVDELRQTKNQVEVSNNFPILKQFKAESALLKSEVTKAYQEELLSNSHTNELTFRTMMTALITEIRELEHAALPRRRSHFSLDQVTRHPSKLETFQSS
ncbi:hypothetical protein AB1Y20_003333 [Prymnesium parvum]|uniref:Centrosomal protein of 162 kDa n=1 Tax=Prymnesium parvum TaxID=97485 RepID=A0AB34JBM9_PRYPA